MIEDIKKIDGWEAKTAAEILSILQSSDLTRRPVPLDDLLDLLNKRGMLSRLYRTSDSGEKWSGTIPNMMAVVEVNGTDDQKQSIGMFFSHITNDRNRMFDLTDPEFAGVFRTMQSQFGGQENMPSVADFEAVAKLGGGWKYASVTKSDIGEVIASETNEHRIADWQQRFDAALNKYGTNEQADGVADIKAIAAEMEA